MYVHQLAVKSCQQHRRGRTSAVQNLRCRTKYLSLSLLFDCFYRFVIRLSEIALVQYDKYISEFWRYSLLLLMFQPHFLQAFLLFSSSESWRCCWCQHLLQNADVQIRLNGIWSFQYAINSMNAGFVLLESNLKAISSRSRTL